MRQNKRSFPLLSFRRWLYLLAAAVVSLHFVFGVNSERTLAQQPNANSAAQKPRTKRLTPLRTSETPDGSRVTITSDGELNDYSAYRSGDRFIVVVPGAEGARGGTRGRGFEGAQVERRGKDLVYTFKLQPGATARVNQRFNRLDVQFSAPRTAAGGQSSNNANVRPAANPTPKPTRSPSPEEAGITKPPTNANVQPTPDARRTTNANASNVSANSNSTTLAGASPDAAALPGVVPTPVLAPTSTPLNPEQLAQAQPTSAAPVSITTNAPATTSPSIGAVVLRNWPWLIAALLAAGIGLIFVARFSSSDRDKSSALPPAAAAPLSAKPVTAKETKTPELKPATASTASTLPTASTASTSAVTASSTAATATNLATTTATGKQSKKQKKKAEKAKRLVAANEQKKGGAATATGASTASKTTKEAGSSTAATTAAIIAGAASVVAGGSAKVEESRASETKPVEAEVAETKAVETKAVEVKATEPKVVEPSIAFDPEHIEVEIKKLLAGESYDESYINATEEGTRQLVSAELMQAIAGRNEARKAHARTAFFKHGYFDEATRSLQSAEAPGERAAAARSLGLVGDRSATVHLTAALEDPAADVRRTSVEALAELQDPAAVGALEALRWRETSRQVPRALIQRAIEASKAAESEETVPVADDDAPTLATADSSPVARAATEAPEIETKEEEGKEVELSLATKSIEVSAATPAVEESDTFVRESSIIAATETAMPEASAISEESLIVETKVSVFETEAALEETKDIELVETKTLDVAVPLVEPALAKDATTEVEMVTSRDEIDLSGMLAAKEASLIEAREQQQRELAENAKATKGVELFGAPSAVESSSAALESIAPGVPELTTETPPVELQPAPLVSSLNASAEMEATIVETARATQTDAESQPIYHSDFPLGSGEHETTIKSIEPSIAPRMAPAEPLGPFFAEGVAGKSPSSTKETPAPPVSETSRREEPVSLFDSLEIEPFEPSAAEIEPFEPSAAEPTPFASISIDLKHFEDATPPPLDVETHSPAADEHPRSTEIIKADKGVSLADGSDEDDFSIIPKGIQVRLASEDSSERAASLIAVSRLNTDEAFSEICAAFDDPQEEVRNAAARALYDLNEDRAESFTRALRESPVERRRRVGAALAGSGLAEEAIGNLTGESRDKTYDAFSLLFLMAKAGEVAPLIRAIENHADSEIRLAVVKLLALSGQQEILPAFRRLAVRGSLPAEVRSAVMEAIYQLSSQPQSATPAAS